MTHKIRHPRQKRLQRVGYRVGNKPLKRLVRRCSLNAELRRLRATMGWSLTKGAEQFQISRDYFKKLIRHRKPFIVRPRIEQRMRELQTLVPDHTLIGIKRCAPKLREIYSAFSIPNHARNQVQARKCRGHQQWFLFPQKSQVYCGKECQKLWRLKSGKHAHRRRASRVRVQHHHSARQSANARYVHSKRPASLANRKPRSKGK